ncbi:MAG: hypothetical protein DYG90_12905 [Chloroflexi bacterium CFX6]|nr:hypothetical protein [Chloroflexi bacterium CFX6]
MAVEVGVGVRVSVGVSVGVGAVGVGPVVGVGVAVALVDSMTRTCTLDCPGGGAFSPNFHTPMYTVRLPPTPIPAPNDVRDLCRQASKPVPLTTASSLPVKTAPVGGHELRYR